jgi:sugar lactone lactonase YvrE
MPKFSLKAVVLTVLALAVLCGGAVAGPFGQEQDFAFQFRVNGFDQGTSFMQPSSLAIDESAGLIYIADLKAGEVDVFTLQGMPKMRYSASDGIKAPFGLAVDKSGKLLVSEDEAGPVKVLDSSGKAGTIELPQEEGKPAPRPGRISVDKNGNIYIVDRATQRIIVLGPDRKFRFYVGSEGDGKGKFRGLADSATDRQGRIYTVDRSGMPVQVFDRDGKYLYRFGFQGHGEQDIAFPAGVFVDRNDQIWVVDRGEHSFKIFDRSGTFLRRFGWYGLEEGLLFQPVDAQMDSFGRVYVLEAGARRLQVFSLLRPFEPFTLPGI